MAAVRYGHGNIVDLLLKKGAKKDMRSIVRIEGLCIEGNTYVFFTFVDVSFYRMA